VILDIIFDEKKAFIRDKQLMDGILLIHELIHSLSSNKAKRILMKLDMKNDFDHIHWHFHLRIMEKFRFESDWIQWIATLIGHSSFSVLINGNDQGFFKSTRGLRQGYPLSPYLFIIITKVLRHGMSHLQTTSHIKVLQANPNYPPITHSQFVDDTLLASYPSL